jgi:hypothetical protein
MGTLATADAVADSPMALVAIIRAARIAHDRESERAAKKLLRERFGIEIAFCRNAPKSEVDRAS